jgi:hypothetical protein
MQMAHEERKFSSSVCVFVPSYYEDDDDDADMPWGWRARRQEKNTKWGGRRSRRIGKVHDERPIRDV